MAEQTVDGDVLLHIGYHKTGTTWMQREYFPVHPSVEVPLTFREVHQQFLYQGDLRFDPEAFWERYGQRFRDIWAEGKIAVISQEDLSGRPLTGDYARGMVASLLHRTFPGAKVWIGIREQVSMLASMHAQTVKEGYTGNLDRFLRGDAHRWGPRRAIEHVDYWPLVRRYMDLFGKDAVQVLLYEEFREDPVGYVDARMVDAGWPRCGAEVQGSNRHNPGLSRSSMYCLRILNPFIKGWSQTSVPLLPVLPWKKVKNGLSGLDRLLRRTPYSRHPKVHARIRQAVGDSLNEGNRLLGEAIGVDLAAHGYP